ncbi:MAG: sporulation protein YqfD [Lachnospiraceae bacterium]|nr:sporulation protein YqfD [Lachnospiraceae bacterium]
MLRFIRGWVCICIMGSSPERFLNLCRNRGLVLWDIAAQEEGYTCSMYRADYSSCANLADKAGVCVTCRKEYGLFVYLRRYRHRQAFFSACFLLLFLLWFSSMHVWKIRIENNRYYTDDQILSCLKEAGIINGIRKSRVDCEGVELLLRDTFERISWSAVTVNGTILNIDVAENHGTLKAVMAESAPADLIAQADGVVESVAVRKGIAQVKAGDAVTKGQVLVSGCVPRHNDAEEVTGYEFVHAEADIMLKMSVNYEDSLSAEQGEKVYIRGLGSSWHLGVGGKHLVLPTPVRLFWEAAGKGKSSDFTGSDFFRFCIPEPGISLYFYKVERKEYRIRHIWLKESEAFPILQKKINRFLEKLEKNQDRVVENQVRIYYDSGVYRASGKIVLLRPQAGYRSIDYNASEEKQETTEETSSASR